MRLLDQRKLPLETVWDELTDATSVATAIREMRVRGAPAIGASAAYGIAVEALRHTDLSVDALKERLQSALAHMEQARPTAINLAWAVARMRLVCARDYTQAARLANALVDEAGAIAREDIETNRAIGGQGAELFNHGARVLTHCNTGSLATVEYGTALGVIRALHEQGKLGHVWVDETRPYLQGARLTAYELLSEGIPHTLITDSMAGYFMKAGQVDGVVVGADRITRNGDTANKIGTYSVAVLCAFHQIPFYVAAPVSTFDLTLSTGEQIPIEERSADEVLTWMGHRIAPNGTQAAHPAFDVTPHQLITAIITERGVIHRPDETAVTKKLS